MDGGDLYLHGTRYLDERFQVLELQAAANGRMLGRIEMFVLAITVAVWVMVLKMH